MAEKPAHVPIALPRSSSSNDAPINASEQGIRRAAPKPWMARARINWPMLGENPHQSDAAANADTDNENSAAAKPIGGRAADEQQCGKAKGVGVDQPLNHH